MFICKSEERVTETTCGPQSLRHCVWPFKKQVCGPLPCEVTGGQCGPQTAWARGRGWGGGKQVAPHSRVLPGPWAGLAVWVPASADWPSFAH